MASTSPQVPPNPSGTASAKVQTPDSVVGEVNAPTSAPGWPTAENYLDKYDGDLMKDYSEDIDNILLLDGLFSAVVTAFIFPAVGLLQSDVTQTSAELLFRITSQLDGHVVGPPPSPTGTKFRPTASARCITSLWFVSLLLSLGSALLGILARQWIREYLNWNSATASSRQNVLVRQIRFEAWEAWKTHALIATIPALLEFAIVLFVCGLVVYVWTIDLVLGIVVAVSVFLFLLLFVILTILPSFYKCCPYRTPTSWLIVVTWRFAKRAASVVTSAAIVVLSKPDRLMVRLTSAILPSHTSAASADNKPDASSVSDEPKDYSWRARDFEGKNIDRLIDPLGQTEKAPVALCMEHDVQIDLLLGLPHKDPLPHILTSTTRTISEPDILFRALSWISAKSGDAEVFRQFAECAESIHTAKLSDEDLNVLMSRLPESELKHRRNAVKIALLAGFRSLSLWYLLTRMHGGEKAASQSFVDLFVASVQDAQTHGSDSVATRIIRNIRGFYGLEGGRFRDDQLLPITLDFAPKRPLELFSTKPTMSHLRVSGFVLVSDVKMAVVEMLSEDILALAMPPQSDEKIRLLRFMHRSIAETITTFHCVLLTDKYVGVSVWESFVVECFLILVEAYNIVLLHPFKDRFDSVFPGLRSSLVDLMSRYTSLDFAENGAMKLGRAFYSANNSEGLTPLWAQAAIRYPLSYRSTVMEDFHIFDRLASLALADTQWTYRLSDQEVGKFCNQLVFVLEFTVGNQWRNGGSFRRLDWLASLAANQGAIASYLFTSRRNVLVDILYSFLIHHHLFNDIYLDPRDKIHIDSYRALRPDLSRKMGVDPYADIRIDIYKILFEIFVPCSKRIMLRMESDLDKDMVYRRSLTHLILNFPLQQPGADLSESRSWLNIFIWIANEWVLDTLRADQNAWSLSRAPEVLIKMRMALDYAAAQGWSNGGSDKKHFPWPASIMTTESLSPPETDPVPGPRSLVCDPAATNDGATGCYRLLRRKRYRLRPAAVYGDVPDCIATIEKDSDGFEHSSQAGAVREDLPEPSEGRVRSAVELLEERAPHSLRSLASAMQAHFQEGDPSINPYAARHTRDLWDYLEMPPDRKSWFICARLNRLRAERERKLREVEEEENSTRVNGEKRLAEELGREHNLKQAIQKFGDADYDAILKISKAPQDFTPNNSTTIGVENRRLVCLTMM